MSRAVVTPHDATSTVRAPAVTLLIGLTLLLAGRAMTLAFIGRAGGSGASDPPIAWLLPLLGDAIIGLTALPVAFLLWSRRGATTGLIALVWNALAIWDALSAFVVHRTTPWPDFFMIRTFGASMFFAASAMHAVNIYLLFRPEAQLISTDTRSTP